MVAVPVWQRTSVATFICYYAINDIQGGGFVGFHDLN